VSKVKPAIQYKENVFYRAGYKYQLAADYSIDTPFRPKEDIVLEFIELTTEGRLTLKSGYASDGPSGPTRDTPDSIRGAFVHDGIYELIRCGKLPAKARFVADKMAYRIWLEDGMGKIKAWIWYRSIRRFAGFAADPENKKKVLSAPTPSLAG